MELPRLAARRGVTPYTTYGARRAVGTHYGPTQIHLADYSLRHQRDGSAGTTILYHLRIYRRPHSSSSMTAGRRELLGMGTAAASAGAAGPSEGLRAGRSSGRTEAGVHRAERTTRPRDYRSGPTRQSDDRDSESDYLLHPTRHGPGGKLLIVAHSFLAHKSPFRRLGFQAILGGAQRLLWKDTLRSNQ